ncbi:MAG: hypothetical protein QOD59_1154, partial [Mycobacterium sp.]|nr:hypothetical protein [Mycobacterium sp.]
SEAIARWLTKNDPGVRWATDWIELSTCAAAVR